MKAQLEELRLKVRSLEAELARANAAEASASKRLAAESSECAALRKRIKTLEEENFMAASTSAAAQADESQAKKQAALLDDLHDKLAKAKELAKSRKQEADAARGELANVRGDLEKMTTRLAALQGSAATAASAEKAAEEVGRLKALVQDHEKREEDMRTSQAEAAAALQRAQEAQSASQKELAALRETCAGLEQKGRDQEAAAVAAGRAATDADEVKSLRQQLAEMRAGVETIKAEAAAEAAAEAEAEAATRWTAECARLEGLVAAAKAEAAGQQASSAAEASAAVPPSPNQEPRCASCDELRADLGAAEAAREAAEKTWKAERACLEEELEALRKLRADAAATEEAAEAAAAERRAAEAADSDRLKKELAAAVALAEERGKLASEKISAVAAAEATLAKRTQQVADLQKMLGSIRAIPDNLHRLMEQQIDAAKRVEQKLQLESADARRERDAMKREVQGLKEEVALRERQLAELHKSKRDLIAEAGGELAQSLADTYEAVMSEEFRVMKEAYEAKLKSLKEQLKKSERANANELAKAKDGHRSELVGLEMKVKRHEATIEALKKG